MPTHSSSRPLSRAAARKAVLGVKKARSTSAKKVSSAGKKASAWSLKRYLGHFGVGESAEAISQRPVKKGASKKKTTAKKASGGRKSSRVG